MFRAIRTLILVLCCPLAAAGQSIHGDPQKAAYGSPDEWPIVSSQCHWLAPGVNATPGIPAHTHNDMQFPVYAEVGMAPFTVPFTITMFHTAGRVISISGSLVSSWSLDSTSLPLAGDPAGVVVYTGHVTFDPSLGVASGRVPRHGWYPLFLTVITQYGNGDQLANALRLSVYSMIDPSQPEAKPGDGTGIRTQSNCQIRDVHESPYVDRWGSSIIEFVQMLPLLGNLSPENPWELQALTYNYGPRQSLLPPGTFELRVDPDLHHGIPGTTVDSAPGFTTVTLDGLPTLIPYTEGTHKLMWQWHRPTFDGTKELVSNLVFNVTVGPGGAAQPPDYVPLSNSPSPSPSPSPPPPTFPTCPGGYVTCPPEQ
jgi:hypothetical protein